MNLDITGAIERTVKENKEIAEVVNNHQDFAYGPLARKIYEKSFNYLVSKSRENTIAGLVMSVASQLAINEAHKNNHTILEFAGILGLGTFAFYTLFSLIELIEIETGTEKLYAQSVDYAKMAVRKKIGEKN
ncbi:hypothetical protein HZA97_03960 [Candidatus Woesearchaeota archaeon]|nr:hypothetical protein [Candidatus Woesearchaeota archaeon]